jgi:hypothetical protein
MVAPDGARLNRSMVRLSGVLVMLLVRSYRFADHDRSTGAAVPASS